MLKDIYDDRGFFAGLLLVALMLLVAWFLTP